VKAVTRDEILPLEAYEKVRPELRGRIIEAKRRRRVALGERMSAVFENHDTMLVQIQEMLRTERIVAEPAIAHEIETYNELVPGEGQLSLTLFIEVVDEQEREALLRALVGMEERVRLEVAGERCPARASDRDGAEPERSTAVQYYRIDLPDAARAALRQQSAPEVRLVVDHPAYQATAVLPEETVGELVADLEPVAGQR